MKSENIRDTSGKYLPDGSNLPSGRPYIILVRHISDKNDNIATM